MALPASVVAQTHQYLVAACETFWTKVETSAAPKPDPLPSWWIDFSTVPVDQVAERVLKRDVFCALNPELFDLVPRDGGRYHLYRPKPIRVAQPAPETRPPPPPPSPSPPPPPPAATPEAEPAIREPSPGRGPSASTIQKLAAKPSTKPLSFPKSKVWKTVHGKKVSQSARKERSPSPPKSPKVSKKKTAAVAGPAAGARPATNYTGQSLRKALERSMQEY